jgi:uncharacterized protein YbjT (DUF2867 family)
LSKTALIAGATGLIGRHVLKFASENPHYSKIIVLVRRQTRITHPKQKMVEVDYDHLDEYADQLKADHVYCCLGTTMKKAGSKENFEKVDHDYPRDLSRICSANGTSQFLLVSALGASKSSMFFYNQVKGKVEEAVRQFNFRGTLIFRPSILLGSRDESRKGEELAKIITGFLSPIMIGHLKKYRPTESRNMAQAMVKMALEENEGVFIYESNDINKI